MNYRLLTSTILLCSIGSIAHSQAMAKDVVETYSDIALATYEDALESVRALNDSIEAFVSSPSPETLDDAKNAWLASRVPYQQSEAFRFGNPVVDDWEGKVNAWPLDEGLIDYVDGSYGAESDNNDYYVSNVIANPDVVIGGSTIDASSITPELLEGSLQEAGGNEANVATGYHAIEFLLWGQDLNGSNAGSGSRPYTDFDKGNCTNGNCDRRSEFLSSASQLLTSDLEFIVAAWSPGGEARVDLVEAGEPQAVSAMLTGLGSLSYGELAGERMRLGLMLHDPEEEHDCFSDNTHNSHLYDALGIQNVYLGQYKRINNTLVEGPSISSLVAAVNPRLDQEMRDDLANTMAKMALMRERAESVEAYDQMIAEGNDAGNAVVQAAIDALVLQTRTIERVVTALGADKVSIEGSDSLDNPNAVFK